MLVIALGSGEARERSNTPCLPLKISLPRGKDRDLNRGLANFFFSRKWDVKKGTQERLTINGLVLGGIKAQKFPGQRQVTRQVW